MGRDATYEDTMNLQQTQTMEQTDRKCPRCGGVMDYDPNIGILHCPYCDYTQEIEKKDTAVHRAKELDFESAEFTENCDWGVESKTVKCKSCGATTVYDALEIANECPYCGSNQVMVANDVKTLAPGGVVPFRLDAKTAGAKFSSWIKGKLFCPNEAKASAKAEAFKGIYLPYWTFDADTESDYSGDYGYQKRRKNRDGNEEVYYEWHSGSGHYTQFIDDELVCATTAHNRGMLSAIEPFDTAANVEYKPEYIAGYAAERYAIGLKDAWVQAKQAIANKLRGMCESKLRNEHRADSTRNVNVKTAYSNITYKYLLLPIWISSFTYKGKIYQFMVNGQTGKVAGQTPVSPWKVAIAILAVVAFILLISYLSS